MDTVSLLTSCNIAHQSIKQREEQVFYSLHGFNIIVPFIYNTAHCPGLVYLSFLMSINIFLKMLNVNYADCRTRRRDCRQATATTCAAGGFIN